METARRALAVWGMLWVPMGAWAEIHPAEAFLSKYCLECHDSSVSKGNRSFEELFFPVESRNELIEVQAIIDQLNLGEMPPPDADTLPSGEEILSAVAVMTEEVSKARTALRDDSGQTVLRRLNQREFINTLEDLFDRRVDTLDPTSTFPRDQTAHHLDTIGEALVTSSFLLNNYFRAADLVVEAALGLGEQPEVREWHFKDHFYQGQELSYSHKKVYNYRYLCLYEVPNTVNHEGGYGGLEAFPEGVHAPGLYEVKVRAHSMNRDSHYDRSILRMDLEEPFRLGIVTGDARSGLLHHPQPIEPKLAEVTVADGEPRWYTMKVWLEKGQQPRFIFPNGMANCRGAFGSIARKYKDEWPEGDRYHSNPGIVESRRVVLEHGKMPHIRIHEVKIWGPVYESWPPRTHQRILGKEGKFDPSHRAEILRKFATRAYRRSPDDAEVDRLVELSETRIGEGHSPRQATLDALKAVLCSPSFLYLGEASGDAGESLKPHDLASRLSYFLNATLPDGELRRFGEDSKILDDEILISQMNRLLEKPESKDFYSGFLDSWLNLRELGGMPPDRAASAPYYYDDLEKAMKEEVIHFMRYLVESDSPVTDFLDADYSFLNYPLAEHYRVAFPFPVGQRYDFHKVPMENPNRRGLLGMAAVLTVSANGIETSPVTRGVYFLENIMGTPPAQPPDEVPAIEPDTRGATTIRDQLEKHRELKTCAECHRRIDPPGFALENFDPIGRWRTRYPGRGKKPGREIDASGSFPDGASFQGVREFREHLVERKDFFVRHLAESLLAYGTGRKMGPLDRIEVEEIVSRVREDDYRMKRLLEEVVLSDIFRSR